MRFTHYRTIFWIPSEIGQITWTARCRAAIRVRPIPEMCGSYPNRVIFTERHMQRGRTLRSLVSTFANESKPRREKHQEASPAPKLSSRFILAHIAITVVLHTRGSQTRQTLSFNSALPGRKFLKRQIIPVAGFVDRKQAAAYCCDDFGFSPRDPPGRIARRNVFFRHG